MLDALKDNLKCCVYEVKSPKVLSPIVGEQLI